MAVSNIYLNNPNDSKWLALVNNTLAPLWYSVKQWFAVFLITTGTLYASVLFNMQHNIFPIYVAIPIAIGITWTYLSGLAYATAIQTKSFWTTPMILVGAVTDGLFGMLYVLGRYGVIPTQPDPYTSLALAIAHIVPLILLLVIFTYCKRNYLLELATTQRIAEERQQAIDDRTRERQEHWRDKKLELAIAREQLELGIGVKHSELKPCKKCGNMLSAGKYGAMMRYGYCEVCKK